MIQQMIYRGTAEGYRVVAISDGLAGKGLAKTLQSLCRMPANWVGRAPIYSRAVVEGGVALLRTAVDPNGTRNHHITHIWYIPKEDRRAFVGATLPADRFVDTYPEARGVATLPSVSVGDWPRATATLPTEALRELFAGDEDLLTRFLAALGECAQPVPKRTVKGVCVLLDEAPERFSPDAYQAMEALSRLYPGLWESDFGYRTFWTMMENATQYPVFFSEATRMPRREPVLNSGFLLIDVPARSCEFGRGQLPEADAPTRQLARALLAGVREDVERAMAAVAAAQRAAEAARREQERRRAEQLRREEEARRQEERRRAEAAERQRRQEEAERKRRQEAAERKRREEEAERQRLAEEAERKRQEEIERQRLAEEAERKRREEEAERQRLAEEAERKRLAEEAERKRQEEAERKRQEEAERKRQEEIERKRREEEAERQRQADEARRLENQRKIQEAIQRNRLREQQARQEAEARQEADARHVEAEAQRREAQPQPEAPVVTPPEPAVRVSLRQDQPGKVEDPVSIGKECSRRVYEMISNTGDAAGAIDMIHHVGDNLRDRKDLFHLACLQSFLEDVLLIVDRLNQRDDMRRRDVMLYCASQLSLQTRDRLFEATMARRSTRQRYAAATSCFVCLNKLSEEVVWDAVLRQELAEWSVDCLVFAGDRRAPALDRCLKRLSQMPKNERCGLFRRELLQVAAGYADSVAKPGDRMSKSCLMALFCAVVRFQNGNFKSASAGAEEVLSGIEDRAVRRWMKEELRNMLDDAYELWQRR